MAKVMLGGVEYELKPIPLRPARELREKIAGQVEGFARSISTLEGVEINKMEEVGELISSLGMTAANSMDMIADWLFEFSAELRADKNRIEETATDEEVLKAFWEALKMLYPFGSMMGSLSGLAGKAISMSSRLANGDTGRTN